MENTLVEYEDNINSKEIKGITCLHYKLNYKDEIFIKNPIFKKWLNEEKRKKGNNGLLYMCEKYNFFFYFKDKNEYNSFKSGETSFNFIEICKYCYQIYYGGYYCCPIKGFKMASTEYLLDGEYTCNIMRGDGCLECVKSLPLLFNIVLIGTIYCGFFFQRRLKYQNKELTNYEQRGNKLAKLAFFIACFFFLILSFVYFIQFIFIYFIYLIYFFKYYK